MCASRIHPFFNYFFMKHRISIFVLLFTFVTAAAQQVSFKEMMRVKKSFETAGNIQGKAAEYIPVLVKKDTLAYVFNYKNAFVVISTREFLPPVKAYSFENGLYKGDDNGFSFFDFIKSDYRSFMKNRGKDGAFEEKNRKAWHSPLFEESKEQYGPLLSSLFGQVNCRDENNHLINVTNLFTPHNYAVGCVAITFTEVLHYFKWPRIGTGSHSYTDNSGSTTGSHSVNYEAAYINWTNILDEYYKKPSTSTQRSELGKLAYNCAVAVNMDFEYNGATSNINRIPSAANKYYRYTASYIEKSNSGFWAKVDSNIIHSLPVQFAIYTSSGAGHAVVGDGLKFQNNGTRYYHLNMGWWGSSNGWYNIQGSFNAGGYSNITAAVVDMIPVPEMGKPKVNPDDEVVNLEWFYSQKIKPESYELQVKIGSANWLTVDSNITAASYKYKYTSTDLHRFRVRAKYNGKRAQNGWSQYESIDIEKAINDFYPEDLLVYPTVTLDAINVEYKYLSGSTIAVFDASGTRIYYEEIDSDANLGKRTIPMGTFAPGMYFVRVYGNGNSLTKKFIKL